MTHKIAPKTEIAYPISLEDLEALGKFHERELHPIMIGIHSLFPGAIHNSPSRSVMATQHVPQHLVVSGIEPPIVLSGQEYEMGKYTFATRMPYSGTIVKVIKRYRPTINEKESVNGTPELTVIYRKEANGQYDVFHIAQWKTYHQYFGFENKTTSNMNLLRVGQQIPAGTKFADTPGNTSDELYCYGVNLNHAAMDIPEVDEDGFIVAKSAVKKLRIKVYETREISFGREGFPVGMFANEEGGEYKVMKEIGERVRFDGLLAASRPFRDLMAGVMMGPKELREVDHIFDNKIYTRETSISPEMDEALRKGQLTHIGGVVKDIRVIRTNDNNRILPPTMTGQLDKYAEAYRNYFKDILNFEMEKLSELRKAGREPVINMTANLSSLLVQARGVLGYNTNRFAGPVSFQYRKNPMDEYTVTFVIEHELEPNLGWKLSSTNGDRVI